jgi:hypothetical protein
LPVVRPGIVAFVVLALCACGGEERAEPPPRPAIPGRVELRQQNRSLQVARATITRDGAEYAVLVEISYPIRYEGGRQRPHVHDVTCAELARVDDPVAEVDTILDVLEPVFGQRSESRVERSVLERARSIDVHAGVEPQTIVACGDLPGRRPVR